MPCLYNLSFLRGLNQCIHLHMLYIPITRRLQMILAQLGHLNTKMCKYQTNDIEPTILIYFNQTLAKWNQAFPSLLQGKRMVRKKPDVRPDRWRKGKKIGKTHAPHPAFKLDHTGVVLQYVGTYVDTRSLPHPPPAQGHPWSCRVHTWHSLNKFPPDSRLAKRVTVTT